MRSEKEKMLAGEFYDASNEELAVEKSTLKINNFWGVEHGTRT